jgi:hypothetical protein
MHVHVLAPTWSIASSKKRNKELVSVKAKVRHVMVMVDRSERETCTLHVLAPTWSIAMPMALLPARFSRFASPPWLARNATVATSPLRYLVQCSGVQGLVQCSAVK